MKPIDENTIAQFFADTGFVPPSGRNMLDLGFGFDSGEDADMKLDGYDGIPSNVADILGDLNDPNEAVDHPVASIYGDFYMFMDPGARTNLDNREPLSQVANQLNMNYHKKDLSNIESASDVHLESLEQPAEEFPRHASVSSQMEPSVMDNEIVLQEPAILEGVEYPVGTILRITEAGQLPGDELYEDPHAKLCPLCHEPYSGDACPCVKMGQPGPDAVHVQEETESPQTTARKYIMQKIIDGHSEKTVVDMAAKLFDLPSEELRKMYKKEEARVRFMMKRMK